MIIRSKTKDLFLGKPLTNAQKGNSELNINEMNEGALILRSLPRRIVFELTNTCNLNCIMCGRNAVDFQPAQLGLEEFRWFEPLFDTIEEVTLMGWGEPTIHPHFVDMLKILDQHSARKYFCTNGMNLDSLKQVLFDYHVDVFATSVNGATSQTNNRIRRGSSLDKIVKSLRDIVSVKKEKQITWPYMSFVFCAMRSNLHELPMLVDLAADIGLDKVKVVYLSAFSSNLVDETLWGLECEVQSVFNEAARRGDAQGIILELPYVSGIDPAGGKYHQDCFVGWRDFFLGSDGFIRPCMSTAEKFFSFDMSKSFEDIWNSDEFKKHREYVNSSDKMTAYCKRCYQSSHCNWNLKKSFIQVGETFSPKWRHDKNKRISSKGQTSQIRL